MDAHSGEIIAVEPEPDGISASWYAKLTGEPQKPLGPTQPEAWAETWPAWSPDGNSVYFAYAGPARAGSPEDEGHQFSLVQADLATGEVLTLVPPSEFAVMHPAVSPTGSAIAYDVPKGVVLLDLRTGQSRLIRPASGRFIDRPTWLDGTRVLIAHVGQLHSLLEIATQDGFKVRRLAMFEGDYPCPTVHHVSGRWAYANHVALEDGLHAQVRLTGRDGFMAQVDLGRNMVCGLAWVKGGEGLLIATGDGARHHVGLGTTTPRPFSLGPLADPDCAGRELQPVGVSTDPSGTRLAFSAQSWSGEAGDAPATRGYVCSLDGSNLRRVTDLARLTSAARFLFPEGAYRQGPDVVLELPAPPEGPPTSRTRTVPATKVEPQPPEKD